jgi:transcription antitermination factor NusG
MAKPWLKTGFRYQATIRSLRNVSIRNFSLRIMRQEIYSARSEQFSTRSANRSPVTQTRNWYALYTASNQEKRVEQHLRMKGVEVFLPLYAIAKRWKNRMTMKLELPLFAGYVFVRIALAERVRVLEVPGAVSLVGNGREPLPLPDAEIDTLRTGLRLRQVDPYPYLKVGNRARIRTGALAGLEGIVIRKDDRLQMVVSIDAIMRSFAVRVHADELEACS